MNSDNKLRVGFFYPSLCMTRPVDPRCLWTSSRGLTGSELSCVMYAIGLAELGHNVTFFTKITGPGQSNGVNFLSCEDWSNGYKDQHWDALCSWMIPQPLALADEKVFRFLNQQCSELTLFESGWESYTDLFTPLSNSHARYMADKTSFSKDKWKILHNGVDLNSFRPGDKTSGKMIWASSHDRGLHWLLEAFPQIKKKVPHANLHIFYNFEGVTSFSNMTPSVEKMSPTYPELARRSRYVLEAIKRLEGHGVHVHESVSRERIRDEMATAEVLAYPCDPVLYTETFGVTVLEACATGTIPVLCTSDAFEELWGSVGMNVPPPYNLNKGAYVDNLVQVLTDKSLREKLSLECMTHARTFSWPVLVKKLEECLLSRGKTGLPDVSWNDELRIETTSFNSTVKLNIGCGPNVFPFSGWKNYDREDISGYLEAVKVMSESGLQNESQRNLIRYAKSEPVHFEVRDLRAGFSDYQDGSVDSIYVGQLIEHLNPLHEAPAFIRECYRMLRPGGVLRMTTPDLDILINAYLDGSTDKFIPELPDFYKNAIPSDRLSYILYGSAGENCTWERYEGHMHMYNRDSMTRLFSEAGFKSPFFFYSSSGESRCPVMSKEVFDAGMTHSFISEAIR